MIRPAYAMNWTGKLEHQSRTSVEVMKIIGVLSRQNSRRFLWVFAFLIGTAYLVTTKGLEKTFFIYLFFVTMWFSGLYLVSPTRFLKGRNDIRGVFVFLAMIASNVLLLVALGDYKLLVLSAWMPGLAGIVAAHFAAKSQQ